MEYDKTHILKVYNLIRFGICMHLCNNHQDNKHFFHLQKFWYVPLVCLLLNVSAYLAFHFNSSIGILAISFVFLSLVVVVSNLFGVNKL